MDITYAAVAANTSKGFAEEAYEIIARNATMNPVIVPSFVVCLLRNSRIHIGAINIAMPTLIITTLMKASIRLSLIKVINCASVDGRVGAFLSLKSQCTRNDSIRSRRRLSGDFSLGTTLKRSRGCER